MLLKVSMRSCERHPKLTCVALAHHYEEKGQHYLAAPLFLQALTMSAPSSCHTAVLSAHSVSHPFQTNTDQKQ